MARLVDFFDNAQSSTTPTIGNIVASNLITYADDAAYEAGEQGSPAEGNIYYNTTLDCVRYYNGSAWVSVVDESKSQTLTNKTIDGTDATGTNTVSIDATDAAYDNSTSGLTATDAQAAIDEIDSNVDNLETLSGESGGTDHGTFTGTTIPDSSTTHGALQALETEVELKEDSANKGVANGYASLDGGGKVPASQLPSSVMEYKGSFDPGTATFTDGAGDAGDVYLATAAGSYDAGSGSITYAIGDWAVHNGTIFEKSLNSDAVVSVNSQTGVVVLDTDDIAEGVTNEYFTNTRADARIAAADIGDLANVDETGKSVSDFLQWNGTNWVPAVGGGASVNDPNELTNIGIDTSVASNNLTVTLTQADGSTAPTGGSPCTIAFRSSTVTSGGFATVDRTSTLSITIPVGGTLGHRNATDEYIYVYAVDNSGVIDLAISSIIYDEGSLHDTTSVSASSDDDGLYANSTLSAKSIRLIGRLKTNQTTAGVWASAISEVSLNTFGTIKELEEYIEIQASSDTTTGAANTYVDATGMSIELGPGTWDIGYNVSMQHEIISGTVNSLINTAITDGSNTIIDGTICMTAETNVTSSSTPIVCHSRVVRINVSSSTTYKLRLRSSVASSSARARLVSENFTGGLTNPDNESMLWARRVKS